jgi:hypothetical protein
MQVAVVRGRFVDQHHQPVKGTIQFLPSQIWVEEDGVAYPCMAPEAELVNGQFWVELTRTDQHDLPWHYTMVSPLGKHTIKVDGEGPFDLKSLVPRKYA